VGGSRGKLSDLAEGDFNAFQHSVAHFGKLL
jgi:hypothetical protein